VARASRREARSRVGAKTSVGPRSAMRWHGGFWIVLLLSVSACGEQGPRRPVDPISDVPETQQRAIDRSEFGLRWPLTMGQGTLGCASGAVVFRGAGRNYAVNDAAKARGFAAIDPIWLRNEGRPTNPLGRITQDERQRIFAAAAACDARPDEAAPCRQRLRESHHLSDSDLKQIDAEGVERRWPPLAPRHASLDSMIEAGLKLCRS
jgi:hypothetical protein